MYHPYLSTSGERNPFFAPNARAQFMGLNPQHTRAHLARAVYEGVALAVYDCYQHIPTTTDRVVLSGGGARSEFWCQLLADCLGVDIHIPVGEELGTKGSALIAGVGTGQYADLEAAIRQTTATERIYRPRRTPSEIYEKLYDLYVMTYQDLFDVWDRRQQILDSLPSTEDS
jgi:sugar (pentulose or hexulose) kinase